MQAFVHLSSVIWLYSALQYRNNRSLNFLVFHISHGISSRPTPFLFLMFGRTMSSYLEVNCFAFMSS